jgi:hypothetical protein
MVGVEASSGEPPLRDVAVQMLQAMQETPVSVASKWAGVIAALCAERGTGSVMTAS